MVLRLFRIRLREIVKINLLPALTIGVGLDAILFASGGGSALITLLFLYPYFV